MDRPEQRSKSNTKGTTTESGSNNTDSQVVTDFTQIPESLHTYIAPHKEAISTGLYYLSLGDRKEAPAEEAEAKNDSFITGETEEGALLVVGTTAKAKEKTKTIRFKLSPVGRDALELLTDQGYSKKAAVIAAIEYLQTKPSTILKVKL